MDKREVEARNYRKLKGIYFIDPDVKMTKKLSNIRQENWKKKKKP